MIDDYFYIIGGFGLFISLILLYFSGKFFIGIFIIAVVVFLLAFIESKKLNKLRRNYDKEKDLSYKGHETQREDSAVGTTEPSTSGLSELERRELLSTVPIAPIDKVSDSRRKKKRINVRRGI